MQKLALILSFVCGSAIAQTFDETMDSLSKDLVAAAIALSPASYWVPMLAPNGQVFEIEIFDKDGKGGRVIVCAPLAQYKYNCLARLKDGSYTYVTVELPKDDA